MTESLPATAVVRVSRASFDPSRFAEVDAVNKKVLRPIGTRDRNSRRSSSGALSVRPASITPGTTQFTSTRCAQALEDAWHSTLKFELRSLSKFAIRAQARTAVQRESRTTTMPADTPTSA